MSLRLFFGWLGVVLLVALGNFLGLTWLWLRGSGGVVQAEAEALHGREEIEDGLCGGVHWQRL